MLTITPIQNNRNKEPKTSQRIRPIFNQKADSFEHLNPSFKGISNEVNLHLPVKQIEEFLLKTCEKIKQTPDISKKIELTLKEFRTDFEKLGAIDIDGSEYQRNLLKDREHEIYAPVDALYNIVDKIELNKRKGLLINDCADKYDHYFEHMCSAILNIIKNWECLLNNGFDKNIMEPKEIFNLAFNSVAKIAAERNIKLQIKEKEIFDSFQSGIYVHNDWRVDDYKLYTVFSNLIQNAVKYSPENSKVEIKLAKQKIENKNYLLFSVSDNGIGIPKEEQGKVLEGGRASNAIASGIKGTGYGLNRVRKIIEFFQGQEDKTIQITSPLNPFNKENPGTEITAFIRLKNE